MLILQKYETESEQMTDKELRALKRADLIEILYYLRSENDELRAENDRLKAKLDAIFDESVHAMREAQQSSAGASPVLQNCTANKRKTKKKRR